MGRDRVTSIKECFNPTFLILKVRHPAVNGTTGLNYGAFHSSCPVRIGGNTEEEVVHLTFHGASQL